MGNDRIQEEMRELESKLNYHFKDISWLSTAMASIKIKVRGEGGNHSEYMNEGLATIGDTLIKFILADDLYKSGITTKGGVTARSIAILPHRADREPSYPHPRTSCFEIQITNQKSQITNFKFFLNHGKLQRIRPRQHP